MSADSNRGRSKTRPPRAAERTGAPALRDDEGEFGGQTEANDNQRIAEPRATRMPDSRPHPLNDPPQGGLGRAATMAPGSSPIAGDDTRSPRGAQRPRASTRAKTGRHRRAGLVDGRYELEEMISKGGMGRVFRARHRDLGRKVALKLVLDGFQEDQELRELFFKEARLASSLTHPSIINVTDFGLDDQLGYFLVMDLLEGETLRERIRQKRPTLRFAFDTLDQIASAVRYIHGRDIVHCDLKPENIFLSRMESEPRRTNEVKLLDFGLSWRGETMPDPKLGGTPPYLAPERLRGHPPSRLCDVYSLGMMLYEMVAGRLPYFGSVAEMIDQQLNGALPPPPSSLSVEKLDAQADQLILRAIARSPAHRHPSTEALQFELRAVMSMMGMKLRRRTSHHDSGPALDAEIALQAVVDSPVPLAIFDITGSVRLANRAFVEAMEGVYVTIANFNELAISRRHPDLHDLFQHAVEGTGPVSRVVLAGAEGGERPTLLWVAPLIKEGHICGVHMTVVLSGTSPK